MKKLNQLLDCNYDIEINGIKINSKEIERGDLFVCTDMGTLDRHEFIDDAINRGAAAVIVKKDVGEKNVPIIKVDNPNDMLPIICSRFYDTPQDKLTMIGVTGTDGKTSVATIMQILIGDDKCGYIGTNGRGCAKFTGDTSNTTPDSDKLYKFFNEFVDAGCSYCSMEVCSEALMRGRTKNILYDVAIYTNVTSEHLNIHGTLENYVASKCSFFTQVKDTGASILNHDDEHYEQALKTAKGRIYTYGEGENNTLQFKNVSIMPHKTTFDIVYDSTTYHIVSPLKGLFNVYNLCACIMAMLSLDFKMERIMSKIPLLKVSGRMETIDLGQDFYVMVDYAHTPNGITKFLEFVKTLDIKKSIVVIGQAGERDPFKRKQVGEIVASNCSRAIFTYEDPRSEDPRDIIEMMIENIKGKLNNYEIIIDRSEAIKRAIDIAEPGDMVIILGKGNETYEKLKDKTIYFNDIEEAKKHLAFRLEKETIK